MKRSEIVKAYYAALDSPEIHAVNRYLDEDYHLVDFTKEPMGKVAMLNLISLLKAALPNLTHSLYNLRDEGEIVRVTVQRSGTNSGYLDLRELGIGVIPRSQKFIIFPNGNYEFTIVNDKIVIERDVSPASPNRRMSGMLKAFGVNMAAL